ncbi:LamG domain-containing protein [Jiulongibacter sediminis]|uniref:LamG-like jellyroll fold domain-containing protein n=1 Tax=Jiulongibacter sediminis TaxID=1605367 RepID=A0A0P7BLW8_9BACT|nr:LamG domain-containing protein [Jiulongibacter sediminis]KPM48242.1 hypothetical protein AFM12_06165 [Jiulongibacter sediminis]TBX24784.1 hypothetical protein TK44_06170 [Jiulongibacter sediminis]
MKKLLYLALFFSTPSVLLAQTPGPYNNSAWGNTLNGNSLGSGGFVTIYSSLKSVDGGDFWAVKVNSSNPAIEDVNISAAMAQVPLSKRLKAKAGEPFTIDIHTAAFAATDFQNPTPGLNFWTADTSTVYFANSANESKPNGLGQSGEVSTYSDFFSWDPKFPMNYYAPGQVNYEGFKNQFVFTKGSEEGYIVFRIEEREYTTTEVTGTIPTGIAYTTVLFIPFVVEGPLERQIEPIGVVTKPQIPHMILHRPPGDLSKASITTGQKTCRNLEETYQYENSVSGRASFKWGTKLELGIIVTQELEAYYQVTGSIGGGDIQISTNSKETCIETVSSIEQKSLDEGSIGGDLFIGYGFDAEYGKATNLYIDSLGQIQYYYGIYMVPILPLRDFQLTERGIRNDMAENLALANDTSAPEEIRVKAQNQADAWQKVLDLNAANILLAKSGPTIHNDLTWDGNVAAKTFNKTVDFSLTRSIETTSYFGGGIAAEFLVEYGGTGASGGINFMTTSTYGSKTDESTSNSTTISYSFEDNDTDDHFTVRTFRDPMFGTPVFDLIGNNNRSSCPFEGGYQLDRPALKFSGTTSKTLTVNDVTLGQPANFKLNICNDSNFPRSYVLKVKDESLPSNMTILANGGSNITSSPITLSVEPNTCLYNRDLDIIRTLATVPTEINNLVLEWYAECEPDIKDSLVLNASWAIPPPPVLGNLPDANPARNIYVCGAIQPISLEATCSGGTQPYWYKSPTGGVTLGINSITDNNAIDGDEYYVSCESSNYISPRSFFGKVVFHSSPVVITESGPLSFCGPGSVTFNSYADNNNKALSLVKANNQYVEVPHSNSLNLSTSFTLEAWVNYTGENVAIIDKGNYDYLWMLNANGNANKLGYFERGIGWKYSNDAVPENTWTHVAVSLQSGIIRFYINGVESGYGFLGSAFQDNLPMNIGRQQPSSCQCNHFNGSMDELRLWNVAKSQAEIQASMKIGVPVNSAGLVAYYKFNEASGTSVIDATGNNNNGVLMNGASRQTAITVPFNELNVSWAPLNTTASSFTATTSGTYTASVDYGLGCTTSVNKTVSVNSNATLVSLSSPTDDFSSDTVFKTASSTNGKIVASNKVTGTAKVTYQAKSLELNAGFIANSGTVFSAEIGGCPN